MEKKYYIFITSPKGAALRQVCYSTKFRNQFCVPSSQELGESFVRLAEQRAGFFMNNTAIQTQEWKKEQWFIDLCEEIKQLITEGVFSSNWVLIETYHKVGELIVTTQKKKGLPLIQLVQQVAETISKSERTIYLSCQFYNKYTDIHALPDGKIITWHKIVNKYLPAPTDEELKEAEKKVLPPTLNLINQDFRTANIKENSIDLILTDPPYPGEFLPLWKDLGDFAYKVLKPSGFLVAYSGQYHLPKVFEMLNGQLEYVWTMALIMAGSTQLVNARNIMCGWKPILIYCKPPFVKKPFYDVTSSPQGEKLLHEWQQSEGGVRKLIEIFSKEGDIILDPFSGAGTFPKVAYEMKRQAIGIEIDNITHLKAKTRI